MEEVKNSVLDAIDKMHKLLNNKKGVKQDEIKTDIAIANATSNLAKVYIAAVILENRMEQTKLKNQILIEEL